MPVLPEANIMVGGYGRYLTVFDGRKCAVRVLACQDWGGDVYGESTPCTGNWAGTAALVVLAWEKSVDVLYAVTDPDRDVAWQIARNVEGYSGITNEFYQDGEGWMIVVFSSIATA